MVHPLPQFHTEESVLVNDSEMLIQDEDDSILIIEDDDNVFIIEEDEHLDDGLDSAAPENLPRPVDNLEAAGTAQKTWKIIIVDDDPTVHQATQIALQNFTFDGTPLEFISAFSAEEGKQVIAELHEDAASVLLDVVMESKHAGLDLVEFIRTSLHNTRIRIILRTGQPGEAPSESVILDYDINDYQLKLDMTRQRLMTSIVSALRSYRDLMTIDAQNQLLTNTLAQLQQSQEELKTYSHNLEILVAERTAKLQNANKKLQHLAMLDGVTQVANRRFFDERLEDSWRDAIQHQSHIGLCLIDIDHFKAYNDTYGHLAGDDALRQVSQALAHTLRRANDLFARFGGEEFGVILPRSNDQSVQKIATRLFNRVAELQIPHRSSTVSPFLTISMGMVSIIPTEGMKPTEGIEMADIALYHAKQSGRNQFCFYGNLQTQASIPD